MAIPELQPGRQATLFDFVWHVTEHISPTVDTFDNCNGLFVEWTRAMYSRDREGLDNFHIFVNGVEVGMKTMYHEVDIDVLHEIALLYSPDGDASSIKGIVF